MARSLEGYSWEEFSPSLATLTLRLVVAIWKDLRDAFACHPLGALEFGIGLNVQQNNERRNFHIKDFRVNMPMKKQSYMHTYIAYLYAKTQP